MFIILLREFLNSNICYFAGLCASKGLPVEPLLISSMLASINSIHLYCYLFFFLKVIINYYKKWLLGFVICIAITATNIWGRIGWDESSGYFNHFFSTRLPDLPPLLRNLHHQLLPAVNFSANLCADSKCRLCSLFPNHCLLYCHRLHPQSLS